MKNIPASGIKNKRNGGKSASAACRVSHALNMNKMFSQLWNNVYERANEWNISKFNQGASRNSH